MAGLRRGSRPHALRAARANRRDQLRLSSRSRGASASRTWVRRRKCACRARRSSSTACCTRRAACAAPSRRSNAATGEQLWVYSLDEGARGAEAPRQGSGRGLAFWQRGDDKRVVYVTPGYQLVALNAATGRPIDSFGDDGIVDLKASLDQGDDWDRNQIGTNSPPTIASNVIMVPAAHTPLAPPDQAKNVVGYIRGFDVVTGKLLWTFPYRAAPRRAWATRRGSTTPRETGGGNAGVWATISADEELGLAYLPVESPYGDMYGGLASRRESLRRERRRHRHSHRRTSLAFSDVASSALGLRHSDGADPRRRRQGWPNDQGARASDEAGTSVRAESRDRRAGVADSRSRRAARQRARRMVFADAADPDASLRPSRRRYRRSHRLHAGVARGSRAHRRRAIGSGRSTRRPCRSIRTDPSAR